MKSLVEFLKESLVMEAMPAWFKTAPPKPNAQVKFWIGERVGEKQLSNAIKRLLGVLVYDKNTGKAAKIFYSDGGVSFVSIATDQTLIDIETDPKATVQDLADAIEQDLKDNKADYEKRFILKKGAIKDPSLNEVKSVSKETYERIVSLFDDVKIGNRGGLSAYVPIDQRKKYVITFTEKEGKLTVRYATQWEGEDPGISNTIAKQETPEKALNMLISKLTKWGVWEDKTDKDKLD